MPPDILVLMTDQHRADWIGAYGASWVRTPNLDRLAAEGTIFTRCTTTSPLCMPARASFLTGQYPHNHGVWMNAGRVKEVAGTYLHALSRAGYRTCHVGKSHLHPHGGGKDLRTEEPYMRAIGWDDIFECTGPFSTQNTRSILTDWMMEHGTYQTFLDDYRRRRETGVGQALWPSPLPEEMHPDCFMAESAIRYIEGSDTSQPLYLFVGLGGPHNPFDPPERFDRYRTEDMPPPLPPDEPPGWLPDCAREHQREMMRHNREVTPGQWLRMRALYSARVEHVDHLMGRVLDAWFARRGRDSWVMFWSDHGEMLGDKNRTCKSVFYEASARIPMILRPPKGQEASVSNSLTSLVDLTAAVYEASGAGRETNVFGTSLMEEANGREAAVSEVDERTMVTDGRWKLVVDPDGRTLKLFDGHADPAEAVNMAGHPDYGDEDARLREQLLRLLLRTADRQHREVNS